MTLASALDDDASLPASSVCSLIKSFSSGRAGVLFWVKFAYYPKIILKLQGKVVTVAAKLANPSLNIVTTYNIYTEKNATFSLLMRLANLKMKNI